MRLPLPGTLYRAMFLHARHFGRSLARSYFAGLIGSLNIPISDVGILLVLELMQRAFGFLGVLGPPTTPGPQRRPP